MIENAIHNLLSTTPLVTAIASDRVYFNLRPQNERRPSLVLTRTGTRFFRAFRSIARTAGGSMQIDALAPTYPAAKALARAVRDVLDGFKGQSTDTLFKWIKVEDESDIPTTPLVGKAEPTYGVSLDIQFMAVEPKQ
jgi:hypothetical protein